MGPRLRRQFEHLELKAGHEMRPGEVARRFSDPYLALNFLSELAYNPFTMIALRQAVAPSLGDFFLRDCSDQEVLEQVAMLLASGRLCLVPIGHSGSYLPQPSAEASSRPEEPRGNDRPDPPGPSGTPTGAPLPRSTFLRREGVEPDLPDFPSPAPVPVTTWIAFRLVEEATGTPMSGVELRLKGPDGTVSVYTTDSAGTVHLSSLPFGTCDLEQVLDSDALEVVRLE